MRVQVLVAAINQRDHALLDAMNIQSDVIVGNQCDRNEVETFAYRGHQARYLSFAERGVGLNRNNSLMRADGDIVLFADDDMRFHDGYAQTVVKAFERHPDADVLIFNLDEADRDTVVNRYIIRQDHRITWRNFLRYGTARVAARLSAIRENGILFHLCFGGGTEHRHGEDNIFLADCLKKGLRMYAVTESLAQLNAGTASTWHCGYDDKYLADQGCLYRAISKRWGTLLCLQDAIRRRDRYADGVWQAFRKMNASGKRDARR